MKNFFMEGINAPAIPLEEVVTVIVVNRQSANPVAFTIKDTKGVGFFGKVEFLSAGQCCGQFSKEKGEVDGFLFLLG